MGLFDKKYCDLCGEKIGLLGNRKLENGNCCKECASKLSPWFSDRKNSTVEEIAQQLQYREENKERVAAFRVTSTYGEHTKLVLDEDNRQFMVTFATDYNRANPDVLNFEDITNVEVDVQEYRTELRWKNDEGKDVSFQPAQYEYRYDFYLVLYVSNPFFDQIRFKLNKDSVDIPNYTVEDMYAQKDHQERMAQRRAAFQQQMNAWNASRPPEGPGRPGPGAVRNPGTSGRPGMERPAARPQMQEVRKGWTPPRWPTDVPNLEEDQYYTDYLNYAEDVKAMLLEYAGRA